MSCAIMAADAGWPQRLAPLASQIGELADAAHVALAARGDAVAHPVLFLDDLAVELVALELLLLELCVAPGLERAEALVEPAGAAAVEPDRGLRQVGEQPLVVADEGERRAALREPRLQPLDGDEIEVIGRLVEQQDVGLGAQSPDQGRPAGFAAGKARRIGPRIEAELGHHRPRGIGVVEFVQARRAHSRARSQSRTCPAPAADRRGAPKAGRSGFRGRT